MNRFVEILTKNYVVLHFPSKNNSGIELCEEAVGHSKRSINNWKSHRSKKNDIEDDLQIEIIHGNIFNTCCARGQSRVGFDRIYVGASVSRPYLSKIAKLLSPGGILVGPVDDEMVKVIRMVSTPEKCHSNSIGGYNEIFYKNPIFVGSDFTQEVIAHVCFAPLLRWPRVPNVIQARLWSPINHKYFPSTFTDATDQIFLCSESSVFQPLPPKKKQKDLLNVAAMLPNALWLEILSFTHRKCKSMYLFLILIKHPSYMFITIIGFDNKRTDLFSMKKRLIEEQNNVAKAFAAKLDAERECLEAKRSRDVYRRLARRWQSRLYRVLCSQRNRNKSNEPNTVSQDLTTLARLDEMNNLFGYESLLEIEDDIMFFGDNESSDESEAEHQGEEENPQEERNNLEGNSANISDNTEDNDMEASIEDGSENLLPEENHHENDEIDQEELNTKKRKTRNDSGVEIPTPKTNRTRIVK